MPNLEACYYYKLVRKRLLSLLWSWLIIRSLLNLEENDMLLVMYCWCNFSEIWYHWHCLHWVWWHQSPIFTVYNRRNTNSNCVLKCLVSAKVWSSQPQKMTEVCFVCVTVLGWVWESSQSNLECWLSLKILDAHPLWHNWRWAKQKSCRLLSKTSTWCLISVF